MVQDSRRVFLKGSLAATLGMGFSAHGLPAIAEKMGDSQLRGKGPNQLPPVGNPIMPGIGLCDPHIRVFNGRIYLYATHDASPLSPQFRTNDWWIWTTDDLVHWEEVCVLKPEQTYLRRAFSSCWATDAATRNGKYYFYFSGGPEEIGVVSASTPIGPWTDPLGKPLIPKGMVRTEERDPGILMDDDGACYIVFGTWDYYIARLNEDMISLAEAPRLVTLDRKFGPYGEGKTDDKPYLHKRNGIYYLSWGCFYATGKSPYGPFTYKGSLMTPETTAAAFRNNHFYMDRHASFFEFHGQWYMICNDYSNEGTTAYFRNSVLSYIHYRDNGDIAPVRLDGVGVGRYDAALGKVEAEDYFKLTGGSVRESPAGGFEVRGLSDRSMLFYPNIEHIPSRAKLVVRLSSLGGSKGRIEIRGDGAEGKLLGAAKIPATSAWDKYSDLAIPVALKTETASLAFVFRGDSGELARLDSWQMIADGETR